VSIGSSGNFFAQIKNGAPFDVFLSADTDFPMALAKDGLADSSSLVVYAYGRLVMWSNKPTVDVSTGFKALTQPAIKRIAIANPNVAPYGRAAKEALQRAGVWDAVKPKIVFGENISQTAQFVETGNADVGLVSSGYISNATTISPSQIWW